MNALDSLQSMTTIVADTGDLDSIESFQPEDATTNPSLVLKAVKSGQFDDALNDMPKGLSADEKADRLAVTIGSKILSIVPGLVSTEVDARLSFDTEATIAKARKLIAMYEQNGWGKDRVLIKIASTWEGIQAAKKLEKEGIRCNLTLLFSMAQAKACADAQVTLISPFVGRILDWYKQSTGQEYTAETDPGVLSVQEIYKYYKQHGVSTVVMGASFRNTGEVLALAGCDKLTISPNLLAELKGMEGPITRTLGPIDSTGTSITAITEAEFRLTMNNDPMATEKLAEGIRKFIEDQEALEALIG